MADSISTDRLTSLAQYCHLEDQIDDTAVKASLTTLYDAAIIKLSGIGVKRSDDNGSLFDLIVNALVLHWYDNRGDTTEGSATEMPLGLRDNIASLKPIGF